MVFNKTTTNDVFDKIVEQQELSDIEMPDEPADTATPESATDDESASVDEAAVEDDSPEPDTDDAGKQPRGKRLIRRLVLGAAALLLVAALGLAGFFGWQLKQQRDIDAAGRAALQVAESYAVTLTSVDSGKVDENFAQVMDGATGEFKDMYSQSATQLRQLLIDNKAVSHGTVIDAAIKSAAKDKVEILLFIDQSISNVVNTEPRIDRSRVTITMEHIDNRWLASKVDLK